MQGKSIIIYAWKKKQRATLNILFHIVYLIRSEAKTEQIREEETEKVREYVKFVNTKIEYINQTSVKIGESGLDQIFSNDKQEKKGRI